MTRTDFEYLARSAIALSNLPSVVGRVRSERPTTPRTRTLRDMTLAAARCRRMGLAPTVADLADLAECNALDTAYDC